MPLTDFQVGRNFSKYSCRCHFFECVNLVNAFKLFVKRALLNEIALLVINSLYYIILHLTATYRISSWTQFF